MFRLALITTGICEQKGLANSIQRIFPHIHAESIERVDSFTSADLSAVRPESRASALIEKFARRMVARVEEDPPDMVLAVDDLELVNAAHPQKVAAAIRDEVRKHLDTFPWPSMATREKVRQRVRERCSFHLFAPMVEAYFFGELAALKRAGTIRESTFDPSACDVELFETTDADFLGHPDAPSAENASSWAIPAPGRGRHPKHYLRFLCDPADPLTKAYRESKQGVAALSTLDWARVLQRQEQVRFARAMFEDLADTLGVAHPFPGDGHSVTSSFKTASVLRNL